MISQFYGPWIGTVRKDGAHMINCNSVSLSVVTAEEFTKGSTIP